MDLPVFFDVGEQSIDVSTHQFRVFPVFQDERDDRVIQGQAFQFVDGSGTVLRAGEGEFIVKQNRDLLRGGDIEFLPREGVDGLLQLIALLPKAFPDRGEFLFVEGEPFDLHLR